MGTINESMTFNGTVTASGGFSGSVALANIASSDSSVFEIPLTSWTTTAGAALGGIPANGSAYFGLSADTIAVGQMYLTSQDLDAANAATVPVVRTRVTLPWNYISGTQIYIRLNAGMKTEVSTAAATLVVTAYLCSRTNTVGSNLNVTSAQSVNSLTIADKDFSITSTNLVAGSVLELQIQGAIDPDSAQTTSCYLIIPHTELICNVR